MAELNLRIDELIRRYQRMSDAMQSGDATKKALEYLGEKTVRAAKKTTPVRTNHLRDSWSYRKIAPDKIEIANAADYAIYVEKGHGVVRNGRTVRFIPPVYMLRGALLHVRKNNLDKARRMVLEELDRID